MKKSPPTLQASGRLIRVADMLRGKREVDTVRAFLRLAMLLLFLSRKRASRLATLIVQLDRADRPRRRELMPGLARLPKNARSDGVGDSFDEFRVYRLLRGTRAHLWFALHKRALFFYSTGFWAEIEPAVAQYIELTGNVFPLRWLIGIPAWQWVKRIALRFALLWWGMSLAVLVAGFVLLVLFSPSWPVLVLAAWNRYPWVWSTTHGRVVAVPALLVLGIALYRFRVALQFVYGFVELLIGLAVCWTAFVPEERGDVVTVVHISAGLYVIVRGIDNVVQGVAAPSKIARRLLRALSRLLGSTLGAKVRTLLGIADPLPEATPAAET